jgi:TRAP-type C4-dicarboxylate transport system substrate-binding protein
MQMKRIALVVLAFAALAFAASAQTVLKLAEIHPQGYPTELADEQFAKLVDQYTNGKFKVDIFPGGQISGDEKVVIEQVKINAITSPA